MKCLIKIINYTSKWFELWFFVSYSCMVVVVFLPQSQMSWLQDTEFGGGGDLYDDVITAGSSSSMSGRPVSLTLAVKSLSCHY